MVQISSLFKRSINNGNAYWRQMTLHLDLVTSGAGTADPSEAPEFTPGF